MKIDKDLENIALFRYGIIAPLVSGDMKTQKSEYAFFTHASKQTYSADNGEQVRMSVTTIKRWYQLYQKDGFEGLVPQRRRDTGTHRRLDNDLKDQIKLLKVEYPKLPATMIRQRLIDNHSMNENDVSLSTITRYINQLKRNEGITNKKDMRRYEREHINEVWCGDSSAGPFLTIDGVKKRTYIIALMDDASRLITGINVFYQDTFINLMSVMKKAISIYGKPSRFNFDNGSPYRNNQMDLLVARIGCVIGYCRVFTPTDKAKIERWFGSLKARWMAGINYKDFHSIEELQKSLHAYVHEYNNRVHQSLGNTTPSERFYSEATLIKRLPQELLDYGFLLELKRKVSKDSVIKIDKTEYEVPYQYADQYVRIRYSADLKNVYVIDEKTKERKEIKLLNKHENAHIKREKVKIFGEEHE